MVVAGTAARRRLVGMIGVALLGGGFFWPLAALAASGYGEPGAVATVNFGALARRGRQVSPHRQGEVQVPSPTRPRPEAGIAGGETVPPSGQIVQPLRERQRGQRFSSGGKVPSFTAARMTAVTRPGRASRRSTTQGFLESGAASSGFTPWLSDSFAGVLDNHFASPPDTQGAVGPNYLMVVLNTEVAIQSRQGEILNRVSLGDFWRGVALTNILKVFDPRVVYDPGADRWVVVTLANPGNRASAVLIAASTSPDPNGNWDQYALPVNPVNGLTNDVWADYPNVGYNQRWLAVTVDLVGVASNQFVRAEILAIDKGKLFSGAGLVYTNLSDPGFNLVPAATLDAAQTNLYLVTEDGTSNLRLTRIVGPVGRETYDTNGFVTPTVPAWNFTPGATNFAPQLGTTNRILCNDSRIQNAVFRNGSLWCVQTVFLPPGTNVNHAAVQWWSLGTNAAVLQRARIENTNALVHYAFPSICVSPNNDVLVGFSEFSSNQYPSAAYAYAPAGNPTNTVLATLKTGLAPYRGALGGDAGQDGRISWGDYSATAIDPLNGVDIWTLQEYAEAPDETGDRWGTWWGHVRFEPPTPPANDNFTKRVALSGATTSASGSNADATVEPGEPEHAHAPGGRSVWWSWTAPANGLVTITTDGSNFDTLLGVYTGSSVTGLTEVASDDDSGTNLASRVTFVAAAMTQYEIAVDGYSGFTGNIRLSLTMSPPDFPPAVVLAGPTNGMTFLALDNIPLVAQATDADAGGSVTRVEFLSQSAGKTPLAVVTQPPYAFTLSNVLAGTYTFYARAWDNAGLGASSDRITVTVLPTNYPPAATIVSPTNGASFTVPAEVALEVDVTDRDDAVAKVDLFQDTTTLSEATNGPPFVFDLSVAGPGTYTLTAVATDDQGATSPPVSVTFQVSPPPGRLARPNAAHGHPFHLTLQGAAGLAYGIETSTNLVRWERLTNVVVSTNGVADFEDAGASNFNSRFYRAVGNP